jgi:hypothetical protein
MSRFPQLAAEVGLSEIGLDGFPLPSNSSSNRPVGEGTLSTNESSEDFLVHAASVDGNESSWNETSIMNQLLSETSLFDIDNPHSLDLLHDDEEVVNKEEGRGSRRNSKSLPPSIMKSPIALISPPSDQSSPQIKFTSPGGTSSSEEVRFFLSVLLFGLSLRVLF